jgi:uncharacterized Zn-finger protein
MRSGLVLALDRTGCLQTARWSDAGRSRPPQRGGSQAQARDTATLMPASDKVVEIRNDAGLREVPVFASTVVCTGESPPEDHPHVSLRMGQNGCVTCPYCGTRYRSWWV